MIPHFNEIIKSSTAWPFIEAEKIYEYLKGETPAKGYVLFATGYGPSGLPHIGTFAEVTRTALVQAAFKQICDIPTRLICFSDDMDGLRKVPDNIPERDMVANHIGKPLTSIPDPFKETASYGHYMNAKLRSFLDRFEFEYIFYSATECYKSGKFDSMLIKCLEQYQQLMDIMLPTLRYERKQTYSPFMPVCPDTGQVLQVAVEKIDLTKHTISYYNLQGMLTEVPVTGGNCKLQWKPDFGMRWAALDVDYEMYGKDHQPNASIYSRICQLLGGKVPVQFFYELFLDEAGAKISKSKGNSISVDDWLHYAPKESLSLYIYHSPSKAKRLYFDVIPKSVDEYLILNKKYHQEEELAKKIANPVFHIHHGNVPVVDSFGISFSLLLNLASVCNPEDKTVLWGFISKYAPDATAKKAPYLDLMVQFAINYYNDFIKNTKSYLPVTPRHKDILAKILAMLNSVPAGVSSEELQNEIYAIGCNAGYDNLRDYFKELYQILLGQNEGPRLGSFFKLFGLNDIKNLINEKITGEK